MAKGIDNPVRVITLRVDAQQLNMINEALRQFETRNADVIKNTPDNLKYLRDSVTETLNDSEWARTKTYNLTIG